MHTTEDTGAEGVPGPGAFDPTWANDVYGAEAPWRESQAPTTAHITGPELEGLQSGRGRLGGAISEMLAGFASPTWKPHGYQERGIEWLTHRISAALFLAPGMGKTSITLAAIKSLREAGLAKRVLILAPLTVCITTWDSEPKKWAQFQELKIGLAHGPFKQQVIQDERFDIVVMNYDGLAWAAPILAQGHKFDVFVCDELTKLKHTSSKRFKYLKPLLPSFKFRWGLTGTPAANGLLDLFGQVFVLDNGARLGRYITHFRAKYFYQEPWDQYRYFITPEKSEALTATLQDLAMYMDPKEYLVLPALLDVVIPVKLNNMPTYKFLRDEYILKTQDMLVTAANAGVLTGKLRQFTGGAIYVEANGWQEVGNEKITALENLVDEMAGAPLIVAYSVNHELERLKKAFPAAAVIKGGMARAVVQQVVADWNAGGIQMLLVQPQAAAHGLNMQFGGSAICWFSLTYNFEDFTQLIARIYRQGQTQAVMNYMLVAPGTIDEVLVQAMTTKDATQETVFQALKAYGRNMEK